MRRSEVLADESVACLTQALSHLRSIWEEIGIPEEQRLQRTEVVNRHVKDLLERMVAEEESLRERLLKSIALCRREQAALCQELHVAPFQEEEEATILQLEKDLRTRVQVMLKQKYERRQELCTLQERDQELADLLGQPPYSIGNSEDVPSLADLDHFRRHLAALAAEKEYRQAEFVRLKQQVVLCMGELEQEPSTAFEREAMCQDTGAFCLSLNNLAALKDLLQQLEDRRAQKEAVCEELRCRIRMLWDWLQVPPEERNSFAPYMEGSRASILDALHLEVDRLEELKCQNLQKVVEAIRAELATYWDKCFFGEEQRCSFGPYYEDIFTEELLQQHDTELVRLKHYYETHQELFEAIHKWKRSWCLFQELEKKATDPSRFTNRGGNLLKEEKLRAKLQKTLPKLEEELRVRVELWEQEHAQVFLVSGQRFMEHVAEQWRLHHLEKEKERQERQLKKSRQTEEEMLYGSTPTKRRALGITTPGKARKLNITATTPNSTIRSALRGSMLNSPGCHPPPSGGKPVRTPLRVVAKTPSKGQTERNKENVSQLNGTALSGGCTPTALAQRNGSIYSVASTYSAFAVIPFSLFFPSAPSVPLALEPEAACESHQMAVLPIRAAGQSAVPRGRLRGWVGPTCRCFPCL
ncbi:protein regulator of cytokinesis 1 isoform X1 [Notechis scutatus]|uniref:Protein regulator of cytokinesis 1 isoform X1 n=1 Tax=Notechis scutatus TaxID=8663 RepID=A0A6J1VB97_9SAUR|nr:protein regulator of cytokinesis 1 isoform X1 [Notechis scutatus]